MQKVNQTELRIGAMHLRLMDNVEQYEVLLQHLIAYAQENEHMADDVLGALEDGLRNHERMANIQNALSSRFIRIERREKDRIYDTETEGYYQVVLGFDDGCEEPVHFDKKQDQLLYILIALCSLKNGLFADFFRKEETDVREVIGRLIDLIWPNARQNGDYDNIITNLNPNVYFTDIIQKMKAPIEKCVLPHGGADELLWFLPFTHKFGLKRLYQMRMLPTNIHYPEEFQTIVDILPDSSKRVDISRLMPNKPLKGFENINNVQMHEVMLRKAEEGDVDAMNVLAGNYNWGTGVMQDQGKAFSWWKKAADLGLDEAQYYIGAFYATGDVVPQDYRIAREYFKKAADQGYPDAIYQLAQFYRHGFGCRKNHDKAVNLYKRAAEMGSIEAAKCVAWMYFYGKRIQKDYAKALKYYHKLAELDYDEAYWHISVSYKVGKGVPQDETKAWEWVEKGIEKGFNRIYYLAACYLEYAKRYEEAYIALLECEERGVNVYEKLAMFNMEEKYLGRKNYKEAVKWLLKGVKDHSMGCEKFMRQHFPDELKEYYNRKRDNSIGNKLFVLKTAMASMGSDDVKEQFLNLVDAYREVFREDYIQEMNKQLSIHRPSTDDGSNGDGRRHIVVRKSDSNKIGYEIVIIMANGEEVVLDSINVNSMMIYLLAIICSYKSGYTTEMAKSDTCRSVIAQLYRMLVPDSKDNEVRWFIENFLETNAKNNYYKTYSYRATKAIENAIGMKDDPSYYLFDNVSLKNRKILRRMLIDVNDIELPQELSRLAQSMPDATDVIYPTGNQELIE
jgi:TPR repeat protein